MFRNPRFRAFDPLDWLWRDAGLLRWATGSSQAPTVLDGRADDQPEARRRVLELEQRRAAEAPPLAGFPRLEEAAAVPADAAIPRPRRSFEERRLQDLQIPGSHERAAPRGPCPGEGDQIRVLRVCVG